MVSAAGLKDVILLLRSIVKTPSLMLSKMVQQGALRAEEIWQNTGRSAFGGPGSFRFWSVLFFMEMSVKNEPNRIIRHGMEVYV